MQLDIASIRNPQVRFFYRNYWPMRRINRDFYMLLPEEQYDYRMVDGPERRSDTPRESLAHLLYVQLVYYRGVRNGSLVFADMDVDAQSTLSKEQLLAEMERIEQEMYVYLNADDLDSSRSIDVFWGGQMNGVDVLYFLRDHEVLHTGWNLAIMDHLNMPRFESLIQYWG